MIGSGLKKFALENGLKVAQGVGYGNFRGYAATLSEGSGYKMIVLTTKFTDPEALQQLQQKINAVNVTREYRVQKLNFVPNGVCIVFTDNPGTMKKIREFVDWFFPLLDQSSATKMDVCSECGMQVIGGTWKLIDGTAFYMHSGCAEKVKMQIEEENGKPNPGSYLTGTIGALLGAVIGAVVWAAVLYGGYVASLVGLLIGFLAIKGYDLFKGKQGKGKVLILILAVIFGVLLGTFAADAFSLAMMISNGELPGFVLADIPATIIALLVSDADYMRATISNIGMGLLYAALGVFALFIKTGKEVSGSKFIDLE